MDKKAAFIGAIDSNRALIYKIAALYTNTIEDREDLSQEIIFQLWKSFASFEQRSTLSTWIYRVAMNTAIYHLQSRKRRPKPVPLDENLVNIVSAEDDRVEQKWQELRQQIEKLNLLDRGIMILYLDNRSYEEIAQVIGISATNVGTRLSRIREKLKQEISKKTSHGTR